MKNKGRMIVVSAPSGCGKGTILAEILKDDSFFYSVSATTRAPRVGEKDGVNYHFISNDEFEKLIAEDGMLEDSKYCDNYYGTPKKILEDKMNEGINVILEIEVQGAMKVREICPDALFIFIVPPTISELERRLRKRGTESDDVISKRVAEAAGEIRKAVNYDYILVNAALEDAVEDFKTIVKAESMKTACSKKLIDEVLKNA
ncbi:MAG: guanylate kinase [Oscillospiraceae bacterium]|nr:guanylate kinase [Oscillospiraceae bacterium]